MDSQQLIDEIVSMDTSSLDPEYRQIIEKIKKISSASATAISNVELKTKNLAKMLQSMRSSRTEEDLALFSLAAEVALEEFSTSLEERVRLLAALVSVKEQLVDVARRRGDIAG